MVIAVKSSCPGWYGKGRVEENERGGPVPRQSVSADDLLNPANLPVPEPDLDPVGVERRVCQDLGDNVPGAPPGALVAF